MRTAILVDGGFFKSKFRYYNNGGFPTAEDVRAACKDRIMGQPEFRDDTLFRVYYYDCYPYNGVVTDPVTHDRYDYSETAAAKSQTGYMNALARMDLFQVRAGELFYFGWKVQQNRIEDLLAREEGLQPEDLSPNFQQKQVDIKIGLDIASLAYKKIVDRIVLITSDTDLIPAMALARREGVQVFLAPLGHQVMPGLLENADGQVMLHI